jgi:glycosyltransferase involved in cell wall biosynthesis
MDKNDFEVLVIDDGSTDDYTDLFKNAGINIRHIKIDHTKHDLWKELQESELKKKLKVPELWYHTPALSINVGIKQAKGEIICISQPEVIHSPDSMINGYNNAIGGYSQIFGEVLMATDRFNGWLDNEGKNWDTKSFGELLDIATNFGKEYEFAAGEYYWFIEFLPKQAAIDIGGVDEEYLRGVYGEDDNFRIRGQLAVRGEEYRGRIDSRQSWEDCVIGIHQSHRDENHLKQQRESAMWNTGANHNRSRLQEFMKDPQKVANEGKNWGSDKCIVEEIDYAI